MLRLNWASQTTLIMYGNRKTITSKNLKKRFPTTEPMTNNQLIFNIPPSCKAKQKLVYSRARKNNIHTT